MENHMKIFFLVTILMVSFSINSCSDDDVGDPSIKFTEKFEMTEWQTQQYVNGTHYYRFEIDYPVYIKHWNYIEYFRDLDQDCFFIVSDEDYYENLEVTILENSENYLKYVLKDNGVVIHQYTFTYKNGKMEHHLITRGTNLGTTVWDKAEIDLSTLDVCRTSH